MSDKNYRDDSKSSRLFLCIRILSIGLLLHFVIFTFLEFRVWFSSSVLQLRKEILIVWLGVRWLYETKTYITRDIKRRRAVWITIWLVVRSGLTTVLNNWTIQSVIAGIKYDILWLPLLIIWYMLGSRLSPHWIKKITSWWIWVVKWMICLSLVWFVVLIIKPWVLNRLWYSTASYDWKIGMKPPAVYFTAFNHGSPRNQFVFERPITYWFWLLFRWPLFYFSVLHRRRLYDTRWRRVFYSLAMLSTISRAAWWARFVQLIIIWLISYRDDRRKFLIKFVAPLVSITWIIVIFWYYYIFWWGRQFSDTWHVNSLKQARSMTLSSPIIGLGAWSAWPASFQSPEHPDFNPENQYFQILVSYWLIGFIPWMIAYCYITTVWLSTYSRNKKVLVSMSLGMVGLSIAWLVLHPFVDRMIVYRAMIFYGMRLGNYHYHWTWTTS